MLIKVNPHNLVLIDEEITNEKEIKVSDITFDFDEEITDDYVKEAYFTNEDGKTYEVLIQDNKCNYPQEVLETRGNIEIGVVAYLVENEEEIKRYNPTPISKFIEYGSLKDAENTEPITPTDKEQIEQELLNISTQMDNLDIDAEKEEHKTTITITKKDGTTKNVEVDDGADGVSLEYNWSGTNLGIKREDEQNYQYVNLKGDKGDAGSIKIEIVNELPQVGDEDTIYLVPYEDAETGNIYKEYIYVNNTWEELGSVPVEVDLSDYYTKSEIDTTLQPYVKNTDYATSSNAGVIKSANALNVYSNGNPYAVERTYAQYQNDSVNFFISKGTLENVITGKDLTTKSYVDGLVGDIATTLDEIQGEVI